MVQANAVVLARAKRVLAALMQTIEGMENDRAKVFVDWLELHNRYLQQEQEFVPRRDSRAMHRGDVILVNLGFNVGSEEGGQHWAVVIEAANRVDSNQVAVIPLNSGKFNDEGRLKLRRGDVPLGSDLLENGLVSVARVHQMRVISKLRVVKPRTPPLRYLTTAELDRLDNEIRKLYTGAGVKQSVFQPRGTSSDDREAAASIDPFDNPEIKQVLIDKPETK